MKLSCCCPMNKDYISLLKRTGYDGIEPFAKDQFNPERCVFTELRSLISLARSEGLEIVALCKLMPPYIKLLSPDRAMRKRSERYFKNLIRMSSDLGIKMLEFGSPISRACPEDVIFSDGYKWLVDLFRICGELARVNNMSIVIEGGNKTVTNMLNTTREIINFVSDVNSPAVGMCADLYHMSKQDPDLMQALRDANGYIWHVHLSDIVSGEGGPKYPETDRVAPGEGELNYSKIFSILKDFNYQKYLSLEVVGSPLVEQTLSNVSKLVRSFL